MTEQGQTGSGTASASEGAAPHWTSQWRARYRPGDWLVLCGPTSLVVLQPAAPQWSDLVNAVWEDVVASASIHDLAGRLAALRLDAMPDFAALFWTRGEMRSLVRGNVTLIDPSNGRSVADGNGVQTWSETGLGDMQQVEVRAGEQSQVEALELPLVIGAVNASRVLLDATEPMQIRSPQGTFVGTAEPLPEPAETLPEPVEGPESVEPEPEPTVAMEPDLEDDRAAMENAETLVGQPPVPPPSAAQDRTAFASSLPGLPMGESKPRPVLAVLELSNGGRVEVDRPVVIGRSPSASRVSGDQLPRLLTVPSPSHDISRTHVQIAPEDGRIVVTDLNSTNGTILVAPDGDRIDLRPGVGMPVDPGSVIDLGDGVTIAVDRP